MRNTIVQKGIVSPPMSSNPTGALGGQMGIFMGASLITLVELMLVVGGVASCLATQLVRRLRPEKVTHHQLHY